MGQRIAGLKVLKKWVGMIGGGWRERGACETRNSYNYC